MSRKYDGNMAPIKEAQNRLLEDAIGVLRAFVSYVSSVTLDVISDYFDSECQEMLFGRIIQFLSLD